MTTKIPNYPIIDGHRQHYVRFPLLVMEGMKDLTGRVLTPGTHVAVDVMENGYQHLISPVELSEEDCKRACDIHNKYHCWTKDQANKIISLSMNLITD